ncbi:hypothetical protein JJE66_33755 [Bradyrhizobium diazoefficiens]|uniref:hypothetical protein n=1 Tax=Bradyrhizobium diazoefficiens TaxID=1355477 RepID=UPI00190DFB7F|nr:hypothetical protein [Bradyrhizobium diazoefficiens]MBK3666174.1 hypothetical protein [Bradyrhizobium diazoefficiens]
MIKRLLTCSALGIALMFPVVASAARTNIDWVNFSGTSYIQPNNPGGWDILLQGTNHYINFNVLSGSSGYGFRDNGGSIEFKNAGGAWTGIGTGGGSGGSGNVSTSTAESPGYLAYWTSNGATPALLGKVATTTASCSGNTSCSSFTIIGSSPVTISSAGGGTGLSTSTPLSNSNLLVYSTSLGGYAYGVATSTLTAGSGLSGSFTQVGSGGSVSCATASGSIFGCLTAADWTTFNNKQATISATWPILFSANTVSWGGLATTSPFSASQIVLTDGASKLYTVASSSLNLPNTALQNSTISGVALGGSLNSLSHDSTLSGTSYNGSASVSNWGINLATANTWTGLQSFANASSTFLSVFTKAYFGGTATTTIDSSGNVTIPSGSNLTITGKSDGCATFATGQLNSTGVACGSGGGSGYPFPLSGNATSTLTQFNGGLTGYASSTIGGGSTTTGLTISGGATTTSLVVSGNGTTTSITGNVTIGGNLQVAGNIFDNSGNDYFTYAALLVALASAVMTFTNKRITKRVTTATNATSITPNSDNCDVLYQLNTQVAGTLTINADTGTPTNGQSLLFKLKCTNAQTLAWNAQFVAGATGSLPNGTIGGGKIEYFPFMYDTVNNKWHYTLSISGGF